MSKSLLALPEPPIRRLLTAIHRRPYLWLAGALLLSVGAVMAGRTIKLKSRIQDLLPGSAPSVQAMEVLEKRLGSADVLVVTLMSHDLDAVKPVLPEVAAAIEALPDVTKVVWRQDITLIERNALTIFPTAEELEDYLEELRSEIKKAVSKRLDLFGEEGEGEPADAEPRRTFSWGEWEKDDGLSRFGRTFREERGQYQDYFYNQSYTTLGLHVYPAKSSGNLAFCRKILKEVEEVVRATVEERLGPIGEGKKVVRVDLGGGYRNALKQSDGIKSDIVSSATFSLSLLCVVLIVFFRSFRGLFCVLVPLLVGSSWLLGLVALTVGYLNLITAFIFAVLLGLGIDFGIHFYARWREERAAGHDAFEAMVHTHVHSGSASLLAATTTAGAFFALTLADFRGFSQFGGVAAGGVLLCLLAYFLVFPALVFAIERWVPLRLMGYSVDRGTDGQIPRGRFPLSGGTVALAVVLAGVSAFVGLRGIQFEFDFRKLGEREHSEEEEYEQLQKGTVKSSVPAVVFANTPEESRSLSDQLEALRAAGGPDYRIRDVQTLFALVPLDQEAKQKTVRKLCRTLKRKVALFEGDQRFGADQLLQHCDPVTFGVADLPDWVTRKFSDKDGRLGEFIFVAPRGSISDGAAALEFREEMLKLKGADGKPPIISGKPMIWADVIIAMETDGLLTSVASLVVVLLLLVVFERRARAVAVIMVPTVFAVGASAGLMALLGIKLNFFNMLALPTVLGMGVDDGVHMYHRHSELGPGSAGYIVRTTGMAALLTTLTTSIGFGSLLSANHYGLNSLGLLTIIGMVGALLATLVVMPAAFQWMDREKV